MNNMQKWVRGALAVAAAAGLVYLLFSDPPPATVATASGTATPGAQPLAPAARSGANSSVQQQAAAAEFQSWFAPLPPEALPVLASPLSTMAPPRFEADSRGKLVLNGDTHANLERLLLEDDPQKMRARLDRIAASLPAQAAAELRVLVGQFQQYAKALSHSISPEHTPETEQEGLKLIDTLHALRVSYLGADATQAMFGAEEATTRQLIALMAADRDPTLTPQQKAERAQEILSKRQPPAPAG